MYSQKPLIRRVNLLQLSDIIGGDNANYDFSKSTLSASSSILSSEF